MLDPLTRAEHLWQPFFDELETDDSFTEPDPLAATVMRLWCLGQTVPNRHWHASSTMRPSLISCRRGCCSDRTTAS